MSKKETYNRSRIMINEFVVNLCAKHYGEHVKPIED